MVVCIGGWFGVVGGLYRLVVFVDGLFLCCGVHR